MKLVLLPILLASLAFGGQAQQPTEWKYIAFLVPEKIPGCSNSANTKAGYVFVRESRDVTTGEKHVQAEVKSEYAGKYPDIRPTRIIRRDRPWAFALVTLTRECKDVMTGARKRVASYRFYNGPDGADIERQIQSDMNTYIDLKTYEYVERFNGAERAAELESRTEPIVFWRKP